MKATKKQIDNFIEYEVKVPSSTYSFYERRQAVRYVKNNLSFSSSIFLKECWAVLYHVDRTNIIDNNDLNLLRYLLKLMLYTLNGETDNSWLEDKYKDYHEKYDFSKDKSFTSGAKKEEEDDGIKYVNGELKYKCSDGLAEDILEELDDKKEAHPHILEEYLLKLVLFANKKKTSKKELENILRVLIPELFFYINKYDTRDIKHVVNGIIKDLPLDALMLGYTLASYVSSYEIRVEDIDMLTPVYKNMKEVLILTRDRNKISPGGQYENIGWFRHVLSTSVNYGSVNQWDNLIRLITGTPTYSNYEIAEFIKGFENESIQTSSLQIAGYIAKYYYDDFVFDLLHKNVDEDLLFSVCNRIGIKEYFYRRYKKVKGVSFSKRDSYSAPKDSKHVKGVGVDLITHDEVAESVNKVTKEALTHKIGENKTLVTEVGIKKEEEKEVINLNILGKVPAQEINFTLQFDPIDIHKISDGKLEPETILMTEELFKETLDWSKGQSCTIEEKKDPRKEAYIKGVYLGIVRELVKSTKDLILSSYNKNLITTVLGSSVGDVVVSAVLVELLPSINLGAKKEFIEKVVELLRLNVSVAVGEFATGLLLGIGKELAKDNKLQELVKQVVTV